MTPLCEQLEFDLKPAYRKRQLLEWVYRHKVGSFEEMSNLPTPLRQELAQQYAYPLLHLERELESEETTKYLWKLSDEKRVESVLICSGQRRTVCVSSQVGCPARCSFCASGKRGLIRDLSTAEIVEQVLHIGRLRGERISHVVFMGMGEPLLNLEAVVRAIHILTHPEMGGISQRHITVSTVGILEGIERLANEELKVSLVLSLHAPNQTLRKKLIPYARSNTLEELLPAMERYAAKTGRDVTYEYTLMAGLNDQPQHAEELAALLKGRQCSVNLIPYNPVEGLKLRRPDRRAIEAFRAILTKKRIINTCRYTKGDDIAAACGQLALC